MEQDMSLIAGARPVAFVAITDGDAARAFYSGLLGLSVVSDDGFALMLDNKGTPLRLPKMEAFTPQPFTVLGWEVDNVTAAVDRLVEAGITGEIYPGMGQDERGIWRPPGSSAGVFWFRDPFGNLLSLSGPAG
jgi:catechol 2,3-dioxygenase-like lactoylglutathione lyase family enzyme